MTEWYVHALLGVMPMREAAMAQGIIHARLEPRAWYRNHRGTVASRMAASW